MRLASFPRPKWVENAQAPSVLGAIDSNRTANRSRPRCEWPMRLKLTGAPGGGHSAANFILHDVAA
jgi:hypothetical protein